MLEPIGMKIFVDEGQKAELFYVWNTNDRKLMVLAQNRTTAVHKAYCCGHVKNEMNANVAKIDIDNPKANEDKFFASIRAAVRDGRQGIVKNIDGFAVIGEGSQSKVYTPIFEAKS